MPFKGPLFIYITEAISWYSFLNPQVGFRQSFWVPVNVFQTRWPRESVLGPQHCHEKVLGGSELFI